MKQRLVFYSFWKADWAKSESKLTLDDIAVIFKTCYWEIIQRKVGQLFLDNKLDLKSKLKRKLRF